MISNEKNFSVIKCEKFKNVLYQKIGPQWFVFMETSDASQEVLYAPIPKNIDPLLHTMELYEFVEENLPVVAAKKPVNHEKKTYAPNFQRKQPSSSI